MPPQVTRQPTHSEQTARRPTHQQLSRKRSVIEIDDDAAASDSEVAGPAESHSNSQSQSQGQASVNQLEKLMESMTNDHRKRHQINRSNLYKDYEKSVSNTKTAITQVFNEHEANASQVHDIQMQRLRWLLEEKKKVEVQMASKIAALQKEYRAHACDLQMAAEQRARQLN